MSNAKYLTPEGYKKLKEELDLLISAERPDILRKIAEARSHGDLSENAEYEAAKEAQSQLESRIASLQSTLSSVKIIETANIKTDKVYIFTKVLLKDENRKKTTYQLVSSEEANLEEGKISVQSPIGKALLGKEKGDKVEVTTPSGVKKLEILSIKTK